jgi:aspartyl aminopeptidase
MHPPAITGLHNEFISSPRLDNLCSCMCSLDGLIKEAKSAPENNEISMIMCFDHEEIGSKSSQGADSNMICEVTQRIFGALGPGWDCYRAIRNSFLVSADMAHAIHPNYSEKH